MSVQTILTYTEIDREAWSRLVQTSRTGTWFQLPEAYDFYASQPELFEPLVVGISNFKFHDSNLGLRGVCVGYVTKERSRLKQFFTGRAIILGGPCLADDATVEEVTALMKAVRQRFRISYLALLERLFQISNCKFLSPNRARLFQISKLPIYIETRNFNDYSRWRSAFEAAGFSYQPHLNFHVDCTDKQEMWERLSDNRKRQVRRGFSNLGFKISNFKFLDDIVTEDDVREWYGILQELYRTKVKTPLWPVEFFVQAYKQGVGQFILIRHEGKIIGGSMVVRKPTPNPSLKGGEMEKAGENGVVYEWYECGMNAEYKEQYPSVMATWAGMLYAYEQGCARYDMMGAGVPGVPYGVRDFKAEFGGTMVEHGRWLYIAKPLLYTIGKAGVRLLKSAH